MKREYTLIMLPQPILVSNENLKEGDFCYNPKTSEFFNVNNINYVVGLNDNKDDYKVIAGVPELPAINFNGNEETLGIEYDYDKLGESHISTAQFEFKNKHGYWLGTKENREKPDYIYFSNYEIVDDTVLLHYGEHTRHDCPYSITLELPLRKPWYPILDFKKKINRESMIEFAEYVSDYYSNIHNPVIPTETLLDKFLNEPKTFKVELEMEYKDGFGGWYTFSDGMSILENFEPLGLRPKTTDNSIKILNNNDTNNQGINI